MAIDFHSPSAGETTPIRVLLVGNYLPDGQESMQRFAEAMRGGVRGRGVDVRLTRPETILGRLGQSSRGGIGKWLGYLDKFVFFPRQLRREIRAWEGASAAAGDQAPLIVHVCDHSNAPYTRWLQDVAHLVTCHDLLAVRSARGEVPENPTRWSGRILQSLIARGLDAARHVACVSRATERDLLRISGLRQDRVSVIANSLNYGYTPMPVTESQALVETTCRRFRHSGPGPDFVLHVGGNQWYKNRLGVLRIYERFVAAGGDVPSLVLIGEALTPEMSAFIRERNLESRVCHIPSCSNEELRAFYSSAGALLFPSLAEGFGWPVIEAQACGCPVLCSRLDPFPEVAGSGACLLDVADEAGFVDALRTLMTDQSFRAAMIAKGAKNAERFQPAVMISEYLECYAALADSAGNPAVAGTPDLLPV